jgi:hypothetical protein
LGSLLGGLKAGIAGSLFLASAVSVFNAVVLFAFKGEVLSALESTTTVNCSSASAAQSCFNNLIVPGIPEYDFVRILIVAMCSSLTIGMYFDYIPAPSYARKTLIASFMMLIVMLFLELYGIVADSTEEVLMVSFELVAVVAFSIVFATLYRRFTREVEFQTQRPGLKLLVDRRDLTGKKRTFTTNSSHSVEAVSDGKPFRGWLVSGGVTVESAKQPKTRMRIAGDGLLKAA